MLSTSADLAQRLTAAFEATRMTKSAFGRECGATRQSVHSWLTTGRIDKSKLLVFARVANTTVEALLGEAPPPGAPANATKIEDRRATYGPAWPFTSFTRDEFFALSADERGLVEGFARGLIAASQRKASNA